MGNRWVKVGNRCNFQFWNLAFCNTLCIKMALLNEVVDYNLSEP